MPRYFLEVSYLGTRYSGFQVQHNANTIQAEIGKALEMLLREEVQLTGSSRTDAGVHARQNYFHFDTSRPLQQAPGRPEGHQEVYNLNAILPGDISVSRLLQVKDDAHCRFDAISRAYRYYIYMRKDPFRVGRAYFYPYTLDMGNMKEAAGIIREYEDFTSFSKRNTQVNSFLCKIEESRWEADKEGISYYVRANRFLRGMVRALTATMLQVGRGKTTIDEFRSIIESRDCTLSSFAAPPEGLYLEEVKYPDGYFEIP